MVMPVVAAPALVVMSVVLFAFTMSVKWPVYGPQLPPS